MADSTSSSPQVGELAQLGAMMAQLMGQMTQMRGDIDGLRATARPDGPAELEEPEDMQEDQEMDEDVPDTWLDVLGNADKQPTQAAAQTFARLITSPPPDKFDGHGENHPKVRRSPENAAATKISGG